MVAVEFRHGERDPSAIAERAINALGIRRAQPQHSPSSDQSRFCNHQADRPTGSRVGIK
jgi:hypothetical protein